MCSSDLDLTPELKNIRCPTLVMGCVHDAIRPPALAKGVADAIPGSRFIEVDSGHFMSLQTPELFAQHAIGFFRE